jgi:hypothetical protein
LPRTRRIASPSFDRSVGFDVLALGLLALAAPFVAPSVGAYLMLGLFAAAAAVANRRRTVGAYEDEAGVVVRGFTGTSLVPWPRCVTVEAIRDPVMPWLKVAAIRGSDGGRTVVTGLRHHGAPTAEVLRLTRLVREHRDARSREPWSD